jgi:RND superfamily putative drug exporter
MRKKILIIPLIGWLTLILLAFFGTNSNLAPSSTLSKGTPIQISFANANGSLTSTQFEAIDHTVDQLQHSATRLGISSLIRPKQNFITRHFQIAPDHSVVLYQTNARHSVNIAALNAAIDTPHVNTQLITSDSLAKLNLNLAPFRTILIVGFLIIIGFYFRSLWAPLITLGLTTITETIGALIANWWHCPIPVLTWLLILSVADFLLPIGLIIIFRQYANQIELDPAAQNLLQQWRFPTFKVGLIFSPLLALNWGESALFQTLSWLPILLWLLWLVIFSLLPIFTNLMQTHFFGPGPAWLFESEHHLWYFLNRFAQRLPRVTFLGLLGLLLGTALLNQFISQPSTQLSPSTNLVQTHLIRNPQRTLTLELTSPQVIDQPRHFAEIDRLTNQLRANSHVQSVASVTQPVGKSWQQFALKQPLQTITSDLAALQATLKTVTDECTATQKALNQTDLNQLNRQLKILKTNLNINTQDVDKVLTQGQQLHQALKTTTNSTTSVFETPNLRPKLEQVQQIVDKLATNVDNLAILKENSQILSTEQQIIQEKVDNLSDNVQNLSTTLEQLLTQLITVSTHLKTSRDMLVELQQTSLLDGIFIDQTAKQHPAFKTALATYHGRHQTQLMIEIKPTADELQYLKNLKQTLPALLATTSFKKFNFSGNLMATLQNQFDFQHDLTQLLPGVGIAILILAVGLLPFDALSQLLAVILSTSTVELLCHLLLGYLAPTSLTLWNQLLSIIFLGLFNLLVLIFYYHSERRLTRTLNQIDQILNLLLMMLFVFSCALWLSRDPNLNSLALDLACSILINTLIFPLWLNVFEQHSN